MELWEAQIALDGLIWGDAHLLNAIRLLTKVGIDVWSKEATPLTAISRYPWDTEEVEPAPEEQGASFEELMHKSQNALEGINFNQNK